MSYLFDSGVLILMARDAPAWRALDVSLSLAQVDITPAISVITQGEVLAFARKRGWGASRISALRDIISELVVIPLDDVAVAETYADLDAANEAGGLNIGQNDLWIAATALAYGLTILTTDGDFERCRSRCSSCDSINSLEGFCPRGRPRQLDSLQSRGFSTAPEPTARA